VVDVVQADTEVSQLRSNMRQYETLVDEYKAQVHVSIRVLASVRVYACENWSDNLCNGG
jgi:hypothetical protein